MAQLRVVAALQSSSPHRGSQGGGTRHHPSPAHADPGAEKLPAAHESMPVKHKCSGGRRKGLSSRNFAFRKVSVKEINVLYYRGHMK